jgi:hypothetical protein
MRQVLRAKFDQHPDLREILLGTGQARLVEAGTVNNAVNRLWGEVKGVGRNMLGIILMELRAEFFVMTRANEEGESRGFSLKGMNYAWRPSRHSMALQ